MRAIDSFVPFLIVSIIFFITGLVFEHYLKKKYTFAKSDGWIYHHINKLQSRTKLALGLLFILAMFFTKNHTAITFIIYFVVFNGFRAFMEWRYERERKRYILSGFSAVFLVIFLVVLIVMRIPL